MRYGIVGGRPRTLEEVGRAFNITRERVRQIENRTLKKLADAARGPAAARGVLSDGASPRSPLRSLRHRPRLRSPRRGSRAVKGDGL